MGFNRRPLGASVMSTFIPSRIPYFFLSSVGIVTWPLRVTVISDSNTFLLLRYPFVLLRLPCTTWTLQRSHEFWGTNQSVVNKERASFQMNGLIMGVLH